MCCDCLEKLWEVAKSTCTFRKAVGGDVVVMHRSGSEFCPEKYRRQFVLEKYHNIGFLIELVAKKLKLPSEFVMLLVYGQRFQLPDAWEYPVVNLVIDCTAGSSENQAFDVGVVLLKPDNFKAPELRGFCLCNFGQCCVRCAVPSSYVCWGCGNNGCCRTGDCGHQCCEDIDENTCPVGIDQNTCRRVGCRPEWAHKP